MRSLFTAAVAMVLATSFTAVWAQEAQAPNPAITKAVAQRDKQRADAAKGQKRAVEAEAKLKADAAALVPAIIASKAVPCTVTDTAHLLSIDKWTFVEAACSNGPGFQAASSADAVDVFPCLGQEGMAYPLGAGCVLPGNSREATVKWIQTYATKAGSPCVVTNTKLFGRTDTIGAYELACADGAGQLLTISQPLSDASKVNAAPCVAIATLIQGATCTLTTVEGNWAPIKALASKADKPCQVKDQRYVGGTTTGSNYYELGCQDGSSYMVQASAKGDYERTLTCVQAVGIGGGCKLSDSKAALDSAHASYSNMVKAAGFDCQVSKFRAFQLKAGSTFNEVIEVGCGNRPESAFALITGSKAEVMNCVRARVEGYSCDYSKPEDAYKLLTAELRASGRGTCDVSGHRTMGVGAKDSYVEVACSDGAPGFVLRYPTGMGKPSEALACSLARSIGGGCQLPTNKLPSDS